MRIHYLQHVPFEDLANVDLWINEREYSLSGTQMFLGQELPSMSDFDWLIILGGPMNIYEENKYPWLVKEKKFIKKAIVHKKTVLGICLGAQLLADVLGGRVYRNPYKEIGWYPVSLTTDAKNSTIFSSLPQTFTAFHWHGDAFEVPPGAIRTVESEGCPNQAFAYDGRVIGVQFHLESSEGSIKKLVSNCEEEIVQGKYIQTAGEMLSNHAAILELHKLLNPFLSQIQQAALTNVG